MIKYLFKPSKLAFLLSPLVSAIVFYILVLLSLKAADYLAGMRIMFLVFAIPFSYLGVLLFGRPSLVILKKSEIKNYLLWAITGFINGLLTILLAITVVALLQKASIIEVYGDMLEPILFAGIAGLVGIIMFKYISEKGVK